MYKGVHSATQCNVTSATIFQNTRFWSSLSIKSFCFHSFICVSFHLKFGTPTPLSKNAFFPFFRKSDSGGAGLETLPRQVDFPFNILSSPQQTSSCVSSIGQLVAVTQFSYSHRYKKREKLFGGLQLYLNFPNSSFILGYQKQSFFLLWLG